MVLQILADPGQGMRHRDAGAGEMRRVADPTQIFSVFHELFAKEKAQAAAMR